MKRLIAKHLLLTFLICNLIPIGGYFGALALQQYNANKFHSAMVEIFKNTPAKDEYLTFDNLCPTAYTIQDEKFKNAVLAECRRNEEMADFETACLLVSIFTFSGLVLCALSGWISQKSRLLHLAVFKFGIFACTLLICISVIANAGVIVAASYFLPVYFTGYYLPKLTGLFAIGALVVVFKICKSLISSLKGQPLRVIGKRMYPSEQTKLWTFIKKIASEAEIKCPENIVIGLEPNFFVTEHPIHCLDGHCSGRTLFISSTVMELLNEEEFKAILLHEFGHFKGLDTLFSLHYSPIFKRLALVDEILSGNENGQVSTFGNISALPSKMILHFFNLSFRISHAHHNRTRESSADDLSVRLTSSKVFASAIVKTTLTISYWNVLTDKIQEKAKEGKTYGNIPRTLSDAFKITDKASKDELVGIRTLTHPFDTHPNTVDRINRTGVTLGEIKLEPPEISSNSMIANANDLEEELTYIRYMDLGRMGLIDFDKIFKSEAS